MDTRISEPAGRVEWVRTGARLGAASLLMVVYTYLVSGSGGGPVLLIPALAGMLPGRPGGYLERFLLASILFGVVPVTLRVFLREPRRSVPRRFRPPFRPGIFIFLLAAASGLGFLGGLSGGLDSFYPYWRALPSVVAESGWGWFALHGLLYSVFYYLPWEFFFRDFLLLGFDLRRDDASLPLLVLFQTIPSTMLHFGHPLTELLSAIPAGVFFGWLAWRSRSILPGLALHILVGLGTDAAIVVSASGGFR